MTTTTYLRSTFKESLLQPAILFILILQVAIVAFIQFGVSFEHKGETLISISIFGREPISGLGLLALREALDNFTLLGWEIIKFLFIIGLSPSVTEFLSDPTSYILLTKKLRRGQLLLARWLGVVLTVAVIQSLFAMLVLALLRLKIHVPWVSTFVPLAFGPVVHFIILLALAAFLGVVLENAMGVTLIVLSVNYVGPFVETSQSSGTWFPLLKYLFPPLQQTQNFFLHLLRYGSSHEQIPIHVVIYPLVYLMLAVGIFNRKDL